jgi:hypothetical protein
MIAREGLLAPRWFKAVEQRVWCGFYDRQQDCTPDLVFISVGCSSAGSCKFVVWISKPYWAIDNPDIAKTKDNISGEIVVSHLIGKFYLEEDYDY